MACCIPRRAGNLKPRSDSSFQSTRKWKTDPANVQLTDGKEAGGYETTEWAACFQDKKFSDEPIEFPAGTVFTKTEPPLVMSREQSVNTMFDLINKTEYDARPCYGTLKGRTYKDLEKKVIRDGKETTTKEQVVDQAGNWEYKTYKEVKDMSQQFGSGLKSLNVFNPKERLGIWLPNSLQWMVVDIACALYSVVSVTLYDALGEDQGSYITSDAGMHERWTIRSSRYLPMLGVPYHRQLYIYICRDIHTHICI